jgi:exonuclease SbcD
MTKVSVLHTADWHIGKQLHKYSLEEDHRIFFDWLYEQIVQRDIDLLLVSGDVFDTAFPSNASLGMYYGFLTRLIGHKCRIIVTGGNHDSAGVLNAPKEILSHLDIKVVGDVAHFPEAGHFPFPAWGFAVGAVPYLRDADLRKSVAGSNYEDRTLMLREGIARYYSEMLAFHRTHFPSLTILGMGHLFVAGAEVSESERDIHVVGNLAAFSSDQFPDGYLYMALGHIHKPQKIKETVRYSGSPIPLSFSERKDPKYVIELTLEDGELLETKTLPVPASRELVSLTGTLENVWEQLSSFQSSLPLEALLEVHVVEPTYNPEISLRFDLMLRDFEKAAFRIVKPRLTFENRRQEASDLFAIGTEIEDLSPRQVFLKRMEKEVVTEETRTVLLEVFEELLQSLEVTEKGK